MAWWARSRSTSSPYRRSKTSQISSADSRGQDLPCLERCWIILGASTCLTSAKDRRSCATGRHLRIGAVRQFSMRSLRGAAALLVALPAAAGCAPAVAPRPPVPPVEGADTVSTSSRHGRTNRTYTVAIRHDDHTDCLHNGHLHADTTVTSTTACARPVARATSLRRSRSHDVQRVEATLNPSARDVRDRDTDPGRHRIATAS